MNGGYIICQSRKRIAVPKNVLACMQVLEYDRSSKAFKDGVKASKYATWGVSADGKPQAWGEIAEGRILLQDHSDSTVSFCNLKIKEFK